MAQTITTLSVTERLGDLESYAEWQVAKQFERDHAQTVPSPFDINNHEHLSAQTKLLSAREEEQAARTALLVEIAHQDDSFLPLVHRLGLLAVFDQVIREVGFSGMPVSHIPLRAEDQIRPSTQPVTRAVQIADELNAITDALQEDEPIHVAMVENEYCRSCRADYDLVAAGTILDPSTALKIQEPRVTTVDGTSTVLYQVPISLDGVGNLRSFAGHDAIGLYKSRPLDYSIEPQKDGVITPPLPRLAHLTGESQHTRRYIDALYIGERAVSRIVKAEMVHNRLVNPPSATTISTAARRRRRRRL